MAQPTQNKWPAGSTTLTPEAIKKMSSNDIAVLATQRAGIASEKCIPAVQKILESVSFEEWSRDRLHPVFEGITFFQLHPAHVEPTVNALVGMRAEAESAATAAGGGALPPASGTVPPVPSTAAHAAGQSIAIQVTEPRVLTSAQVVDAVITFMTNWTEPMKQKFRAIRGPPDSARLLAWDLQDALDWMDEDLGDMDQAMAAAKYLTEVLKFPRIIPPVYISGATGDNAGAINGPYSPTQEKGADGRVVYSKDGDASICIEHFAGKWQVKLVSSKGKDVSHGCYVQGGCALEDCASRAWNVFDNGKWTDQTIVKIVTGAEAQREVGRPCIVYHTCHSARCALIPSRCAGCRVCRCH